MTHMPSDRFPAFSVRSGPNSPSGELASYNIKQINFVCAHAAEFTTTTTQAGLVFVQVSPTPRPESDRDFSSQDPGCGRTDAVLRLSEISNI